MTCIKAIVNVAPGKAEIQEVSYPELADGFMIVKPTAWAVNPDDVYHLDLTGEESCVGTRVGADYAGVVVTVGPGVTKDFKEGDRVAGWALGQNLLDKTGGAYADYFAVKGDAQMKIPENVSDSDAATQGIAVSTLSQSFYRDLKLPLPGTTGKPFTIFIYGGSTAMGIAGIQWAKLSGGTVITTASPSNFNYLRSLGADHLLDYKSPSLSDDVRELGGGSVLYAFDTYPTEESAAICAKVLSRKGDAKYVTLIPGVEKEVTKLNPSVEVFSVLAFSALGDPYVYELKYWDASQDDFELQKKFVTIAEDLLAQGKMKAPKVYLNRGGSGFEGLLHGLSEVREGNVRAGKLVYTIG